MKNISYTTLQKKFSGKVVAVSEKKGVDPTTCVFLGPIEQYKQVSVY